MTSCNYLDPFTETLLLFLDKNCLGVSYLQIITLRADWENYADFIESSVGQRQAGVSQSLCSSVTVNGLHLHCLCS